MSEPRWKKGDLVRHRASKQVAVVFSEPRRNLPPLEEGFVYVLDPGFDGRMLNDVPEFVLEGAPAPERSE